MKDTTEFNCEVPSGASGDLKAIHVIAYALDTYCETVAEKEQVLDYCHTKMYALLQSQQAQQAQERAEKVMEMALKAGKAGQHAASFLQQSQN